MDMFFPEEEVEKKVEKVVHKTTPSSTSTTALRIPPNPMSSRPPINASLSRTFARPSAATAYACSTQTAQNTSKTISNTSRTSPSSMQPEAMTSIRPPASDSMKWDRSWEKVALVMCFWPHIAKLPRNSQSRSSKLRISDRSAILTIFLLRPRFSSHLTMKTS